MEFLRVLEGLRTPFWDNFFLFFTAFGDEIVFTIVIVGTLWCVDKRAGRWMFFAWISGSALVQYLKAVFMVPRPWVTDGSFSAVEKALKTAPDYSFPSGHAQSVTGLFGSAAVFLKRAWARVLCAAVILLTVFSRMYLGVHTPVDVAAGAGLGLLAVAVMVLFMRVEKSHPRIFYLACAVVLPIALLLFVHVAREPGLQSDGTLAQSLYNGGKLVGGAAGIALSFYLDRKYVNFDVKARLWVQPLKFAVGAGLLLGIKALKAPLHALAALVADGTLSLLLCMAAADALRYFLLALFAGIVYPLTFKYWAKI